MIDSTPAADPVLGLVVGEAPFDELRNAEGNIRPHWQRYFEYLDTLGTHEAKARWTKAKQLLQENGASYNSHGDQAGAERPWRLSPMPLLLSPGDWQLLSRGIAQRARLLNCLLGDLYGPQRTITDGDLPCELVFDNPRFLRALHGLGTQRSSWLPLYGVDLIRSPSGTFNVIDDCTQAPAGMGYALENRVVVAQALPDLLRHCNVERLVSFFRLFGERLQAAAAHNRDAPRIALLTPGPFSATYFEQAYLAKYLGMTLVQGEDLTVRNDRVYLKTLGGLQPIDVILRRVFDDFCDPLELRPESELGVPGLVQAMRSGNINAVNPLGTGLLETPALFAYLPGICRKLLREELLLESVPTYYCGDPNQRQLVLDEFDNMVLKSTFAVGHANSMFVHQLDLAERDTLRQELISAPQQFVAQRFVPAAKTPIISKGAIHSRAFVLRCFANCNQPNDYQVMPGGLGLVATTDEELAVSLHRGARSKDVWVISEEDIQDGLAVPPSNPAVELSRGGGDLPSRVADNLYWLGRYTERTEAVSRLTRVIGARLSDFRSERDMLESPELSRLFNALRMQIQFLYSTEAPVSTHVSQSDCEQEFVTAVWDSRCSGSVVSAIRSTLKASRTVRDRFSHDTWRILSSLDETVERLLQGDRRQDIPHLVGVLNQVIIGLAAFSGLVMESMTRGLAWRFLDMGRRLERAINLVILLRATFLDRCERQAPLIEAVLDVADSGMTYRRRYPAGFQTAPAVDLLLADDSNPRSVIYQLMTLGEHIAALPPLATQGVRSTQQRLVLSATSQVQLSDINELCGIDAASNRRQELGNLLRGLGTLLPALSDSLTETYLYHAAVARHLKHQGAAQGEQANLGRAT